MQKLDVLVKESIGQKQHISETDGNSKDDQGDHRQVSAVLAPKPMCSKPFQRHLLPRYAELPDGASAPLIE